MIVGAKFVRVKIANAGDPAPVIVYRRPSDEESAEFTAKLIAITKLPEDQRAQAAYRLRIEHANQLMHNVENFEFIDDAGATVPLTPEIPGWQDKIDSHLRARSVLMAFEGAEMEIDYSKK